MNENSGQSRPAEGTGELACQSKVPRFVSIAELMASMGLSRSSINRQIKAGNIPVSRIGSRILIPRSYLENLQDAAEATIKAVE